MNTQYRKNLKSVLEASKNYCDNKINDMYWRLGEYEPDTETDTDVKYQSSVPSGTISARLESIGGMSYKYNQYAETTNTTNWNAASISNGSVSIIDDTLVYTNSVVTTGYLNGVASTRYYTTIPSGHKLLITLQAKASQVNADTRIGYDILNKAGNFSNNLTTDYQFFSSILTSSSNNNIYICYRNNPVLNSNLFLKNIQLFDLTQMFGSGNEPADVATATTQLALRGIDITQYNAYDTGSIRHSAVSSVVASGTGMTDITQDIPADVEALEGYGWGISSSVRNYISFDKDTNKWYYNQMVGSVDMGSLNWSYDGNYMVSGAVSNAKTPINNNGLFNGLCSKYELIALAPLTPQTDKRLAMTQQRFLYVRDSAYSSASAFKSAMSGTYLYYELETPVQTDITSLMTSFTNPFQLTDDYSTITYTNTYNNAIPYSITYLKEVAK